MINLGGCVCAHINKLPNSWVSEQHLGPKAALLLPPLKGLLSIFGAYSLDYTLTPGVLACRP